MAKKIAVIGGGGAGMMAAYVAAKEGKQVTLFEKNNMLGRKLLITGKGRCNVTNNCDVEELIRNVTHNAKFLYSAFSEFSSKDTIDFFEKAGVALKTERGRRVFPESDRSVDIVNALRKAVKDYKVKVINESVSGVTNECVVQFGNKSEKFDSVIIATGGKSYPLTGSTGDGYKFALNLGHSVTELRPALAPIETQEKWVKNAAGLSLKNTDLICLVNGKKIFYERGEMLFTHRGISGPMVLSLSSVLKENDFENAEIIIDLKPALDEQTLDKRILREFEFDKNKIVKNVIRKLLPQSVIEPFLVLANVNGEKKVNSVTSEERLRIVKTMKKIKLTPKAYGGFDEAIITAGGISVKEINPKTMESKLVKGIYFAGEIIDVDAYTGGYNLQIAFSTGYLAGKNA